MKYKIIYEENAVKDIFNIVDYIEKEFFAPVDAAKTAIRIYKKCEALILFPKSSPIRHVTASGKSLRFTHTKGYLIAYYVDDSNSTVHIYAVINSLRDILPAIKAKE